MRNPVGAMVFLGLRETLRAALVDRALSGMPVDSTALSREERVDALAKIDADLTRLEIAEEQVIRGAESAGIALPRRDDARPEIFLLPDEDLR